MSLQFAALKEHLAAIEAQKLEIESKLAEEEAQAKLELLEQFKAQIAACGFDAEEIALAIAPKLTRQIKKAKAKTTGTRKAGITKVYYNPADPSQIYSKGPAPAWMKTMMAEAGIDITDKAAVKTFKETHLLVQGAQEPVVEAAETPVAEAPSIGLPPALPEAMAA